MKFRTLVSAFVLMAAGFAGPALATSSADAVTHESVAAAAKHACTRTSSGKCIKGGQFCPQSKWHKNGWDAKGRRYVCKGNHSHPHWMKP
jgi:hypothetical protein